MGYPPEKKQPALPGTLNYQKCRIGQAVLLT